MTRIFTTAHINCKPSDLFPFVTTPGNWPQWHPSSLRVRGATDHSLAVGEAVTEAFSVAGQRGEVVWTVIDRQEPYRWIIEGKIVGRRHGGVITYALRQDGDGTFFERTFTYPTPTLYFALLDRLIVRWRIQQESNRAVQQLKALCEIGRVQTSQQRTNEHAYKPTIRSFGKG